MIDNSISPRPICVIFCWLLHTLDSLYDNSGGCTTSVADSCDTILSWLELVEKGGKDARTRTSKGMAE